jgi:hypothetical protein
LPMRGGSSPLPGLDGEVFPLLYPMTSVMSWGLPCEPRRTCL